MRVPRLDVRARRLAALGAAIRGARGRRGAQPPRDPPGELGPFRFVNLDGDAPPLDEFSARCRRCAVRVASTSTVSVPPPSTGKSQELEDRDGELPRAVTTAPWRTRVSRRWSRPRPASTGWSAVPPEPVRPTATQSDAPLPEGQFHPGRTPASTSSLAGRTRSARSCRSSPTGPGGSSTTSSLRTRMTPGSPSSSSSTTRSGRRTRDSSSPCSAAPVRAQSQRLLRTASNSSRRFRRGCPRRSLGGSRRIDHSQDGKRHGHGDHDHRPEDHESAGDGADRDENRAPPW